MPNGSIRLPALHKAPVHLKNRADGTAAKFLMHLVVDRMIGTAARPQGEKIRAAGCSLRKYTLPERKEQNQ